METFCFFREKLAQLEDEQAKKSTSNTNEESPKASRNNAIKRLLIKNLRLAAMIATKEIELEEARGRTLDCKLSLSKIKIKGGNLKF